MAFIKLYGLLSLCKHYGGDVVNTSNAALVPCDIWVVKLTGFAHIWSGKTYFNQGKIREFCSSKSVATLMCPYSCFDLVNTMA